MRRGLATGLVLVGVAWLVPVAARAMCHPLCVRTSDRQVVAFQNSFRPSQWDIKAGGLVTFHNLDGWEHTVTHVGCVDADAGTPCEFDMILTAGPLTSVLLYTGPDPDKKPNKAPVGNYQYVCRYHQAQGMGGTLNVTY